MSANGFRTPDPKFAVAPLTQTREILCVRVQDAVAGKRDNLGRADQGRLSGSPRCDGSMIEGVESMRGTASMDRIRNLIVGGGAVAALAGLYLLVADDRSARQSTRLNSSHSSASRIP